MSNSKAILNTAYLPPIQYMAKIVSYDSIEIEVFESYAKQSYRNRCVILSCNGPLSLSIPIVKVNGNNTLTKDVEIDYSTNWQKLHWKAIESAYRNSTYFDFVADFLCPFYSRREDLLIDFNSRLLEEILKFIGVDKQFTYSNVFLKTYPFDVEDFRSLIHPKLQYQHLDDRFNPVKYYQVFNNKFNFFPNLSVIDLLFNEGLEALSLLEQTIAKAPA
ncbi:MAG TPA: hypothetical protein DIW31_01000 [Bacteroidales bacterium]|nr:hypothetical protein [Bacteroidales bacterium]